TPTSNTSTTNTAGFEITDIDPAISALTAIPEPIRRTTGDPDAGWDYLRYGGYVGSGIPYDIFIMFFGKAPDLLNREGDNADLPPSFNAFDAPNGARVVGGLTCFGCHSSTINGEYIVGLGDAFSDFSDQIDGFGLLQGLVESQFGPDSPEAESSAVFVRGAEAVTPLTDTPFAGVNPAFRLEEAAATHRNPADLTWVEEPLFPIEPTLLASDVPPLWNVAKKNGLYYNGMGRGDLARLIIQVLVVAIIDSEQAATIDANADDILAWLQALEPPPWPGAIDSEQAAAGEQVFATHCASCHGTYGDQETYPNLLVPLEMVGTDPAYARFFVERSELTDWYNSSWFAQESQVAPVLGYIAPPLDGVWATAPYLHNGSIPSLEALLNSNLRPEAWRRNFSSSTYDMEAVGWPWEIANPGSGEWDVYDTTLEGFNNSGHTFSDMLSNGDRSALLEYLKTL
ncbi:MAG: cytochrome c, partial [Myxococcota bacterium]